MKTFSKFVTILLYLFFSVKSHASWINEVGALEDLAKENIVEGKTPEGKSCYLTVIKKLQGSQLSYYKLIFSDESPYSQEDSENTIVDNLELQINVRVNTEEKLSLLIRRRQVLEMSVWNFTFNEKALKSLKAKSTFPFKIPKAEIECHF